jgi:aminoglycoside N3'-acetyltransferase
MSALTEKEFIDVLEATLPADDDIIAIYSGIWTFAPQFRWPAEEIGPRLLKIVDDFVGPDRTLIFPAYSYLDFARNRTYDLTLSKPETGVLPESALADKAFTRSRSPMNSYAVRGPRADELLSRPSTTAWGPDGVLGWMCEADIRICILGVSWLSCSLMHHAEETLQVPYRYYKRFKGEIFDNGESLGACEEVMYSRSLHAVPEWDITSLGPALSDAGVVLKSPNRRIPMESAKASEFHRVNEAMFAADPYVYHENVDELKAWVENGKEAEMATLKPEERWPPEK